MNSYKRLLPPSLRLVLLSRFLFPNVPDAFAIYTDTRLPRGRPKHPSRLFHQRRFPGKLPAGLIIHVFLCQGLRVRKESHSWDAGGDRKAKLAFSPPPSRPARLLPTTPATRTPRPQVFPAQQRILRLMLVSPAVVFVSESYGVHVVIYMIFPPTSVV